MTDRASMPLIDAMHTHNDKLIGARKPWSGPVRVAVLLLAMVVTIVVLHLLTQWMMNSSVK